ncbi:Uncharacterised protein [Enterobacter cloacae]|uniref:Uncharacterized protein n=1 Tax=Enterobacter cloacae TaxID=550 RepID=A0A377LQR7_ENTCL|nr:Uncharacterised protein [Enterobacter cloacae]
MVLVLLHVPLRFPCQKFINSRLIRNRCIEHIDKLCILLIVKIKYATIEDHILRSLTCHFQDEVVRDLWRISAAASIMLFEIL